MRKTPEELKRSDPFLSDPDNLHFETLCVNCKRSLWVTRILKRFGDRVGSTEILPCDPQVKPFNRLAKWCDFCGNRFYGIKRGVHMYLIKDLNSGVTRLV